MHHDRLFRLKRLLDTIKVACKTFDHPYKNLAVDERVVASRAKTAMTQYMKANDSRNGYTVDFSIYTGKSDITSGRGLSYDMVLSLVQPGFLGTGYHIYKGNFYSSPKLFRAVHQLIFGACGT